MILALLPLVALAEPHAASLRGTVEPQVALAPARAEAAASDATVPPTRLPGDACPVDAVRDAADLGGARWVVSACTAGVWVGREGEGATRLPGALPDGVAAGARLRGGADGEAVAVVWTTQGDVRTTAWRVGPAAPFELAPRTLPAGPPLLWPVPTSGDAGRTVHSHVDARLPEGAVVHAVTLTSDAVVLAGTVRTTEGARQAELRVARAPRLPPPGR